MKRIDWKEVGITLLVMLVACICLCLSSCKAKKEVVKEEETSSLAIYDNKLEKDASVIEYKVDTTRECEQTISYDIVEYYPTIDSATHIQPIKTITKTKVTNKKKRNGISNKDSVQLNIDSTIVQKDSIGSKNVAVNKSSEPKSTTLRWWWLILLLLLVGYMVYKFKK